MVDARVNNEEGATILLSGPSGCGKTTLVMKFLHNAKDIFTNPRCMQRILFYYHVDNTLFKQFRHLKNIEWINEYPSKLDYIIQVANQFEDKGGICVVIDDFQSSLDSSLELLFTALCHHKKIVCFLLLQNIFFGSKPWQRSISLNCRHIIVFPNYRDKKQFRILVSQIEPGDNGKYLMEAFNSICDKSDFSYLWVDCTPKLSHNYLRIKSHMFSDEGFPCLYIPRESRFEHIF